jgi:hypothetical protein
MTQLQRIVIEMKSGELVMRVLYRSEDGPNPGTKGRTRVVADLARSGLRDALEALSEEEATMCGTSGYTTREDLLVAELDTKDARIASESGAEAEGSAA